MSATPTDVNVRMVADGDPERVRYRSTPRQILPLAAVFGCLSLSWLVEWLMLTTGPARRGPVSPGGRRLSR